MRVGVVAAAIAATTGWREANAESLGSRLHFPIPSALYRENGYVHEEALFGIPKYGGSIAEKLIFGGVANNELTKWTLCSNDDASSLDGLIPKDNPFILMVDRGDCTFVSKVRRAQHLGASGVIIADNTCLCKEEESRQCTKAEGVQCEPIEPIMADDGSGADIAIPSFLMKKKNAEEVKNFLRDGITVQAEMTWSLPAPDDRVEWSLWTSAIDTSSAPFKRDFKDVVKMLGKKALFTPFYVVYDGDSYGCTANGSSCGSLCTNKGRYCMTDPDFDTTEGVSGADVVKESLRQKCIWNLYGGEQAPDKDKGIGEKWWTYVNTFYSSCPIAGERFTDPDCIAGAMRAAGVSQRDVEKCIFESGGTEGDVENEILHGELTQKDKNSIVIVPTVYVNNVAERGGISTAAVLSTICAGYKSGTEPDVCRCAGQRTSELVNACMQNRSSSGSGDGGMTLGSTLFLLLVVAGFFAAAGYVHYKRTQAQMRDQVRGILAEYMPLEDIDAPGSSARVPFMDAHQRNIGRAKETQLV